MQSAFADILRSPIPPIDEQLERQIDAANCAAGGRSRDYVHRKYGADHCAACQPKLSFAEALWDAGPLSSIGAQVQAALYEQFGGVQE